MQNKPSEKCCPSQLRYDEVSKDWVVVAPGRGKRPEAFKRERIKSEIGPRDCVFCNLNEEMSPILMMKKGENVPAGTFDKKWTLAVIPNKYPSFFPPMGKKICKNKEGDLYHSMDAVGFCEVVLTRDHRRHIALLDISAIKEIVDAYQSRFVALRKNNFVEYVSIFHNHGVEAGASQPHPHSQIITSPLVDVDLRNALRNAKKYHRRHKKCLSCEMTEWEIKSGQRVVYQNDDFVAVCPFASKTAFEVVISPIKHLSRFELINESQKENLAQIFSVVMKKIYKGLGDPPYNFYLHTAPCDSKDYSYYHWHWTILPKTDIAAGFEMNARMEIVSIAPEAAAEYLRDQRI